MIYLDYSANTPVDKAVLERFCKTEQQFFANPNSVHRAGIAAQEELQRVTHAIAKSLGVQAAEIIYTSGASEANNLALKGIARTSRHAGRHIISSALEHASVGATLSALQRDGYEIDLVDIRRDGTIDLEHLHELLRPDTVLVSFCAVDSEIGTVQPIGEIAQLLADYPNCHFHVDATQAIGKTPLALSGIDTLSLAPHKFYGLNGSGILYKRDGLVLEPLIHGGSGASLYRSGTPALALAASIETALELALSRQETRSSIVSQHNHTLRHALSRYEKVKINSPANAVPHILNISVQGVKASAFQDALDAQGVCISVKSACASDASPSKAVFAVSRNRKNAMSSFRISLSHLTTQEEIDSFLSIFEHCYRELTT